MLRASTTQASRRDANSRRCWESGGGRICRVAVELVVSGGFGIAKLKTGRRHRINPLRSAQQNFWRYRETRNSARLTATTSSQTAMMKSDPRFQKLCEEKQT
jgi:hypothetical protein